MSRQYQQLYAIVSWGMLTVELVGGRVGGGSHGECSNASYAASAHVRRKAHQKQTTSCERITEARCFDGFVERR